MHNSYAFNRTKRTIGIFKRPDKLEAIASYLSPEPDSRLRTRFYLYTRRNADQSQELTIGNPSRLARSWFDPSRPIKFVINGWLDNRYFAKWVRSGISALLAHGDYNVIYVGWKSINELFVAAITIKLFSQDLAQFIIFLKNTYGIDGETIHCIGHSLGSLLCGFAGAITYMGRVSVLDAGPRAWFEPLPEWQRINRWQAGFVDVIHSDYNPKLSWGLTLPVGDVDFYPNSAATQPGCARDMIVQAVRELRDEGLVVGVYQWLRYTLFCSHYRSHEWWFESVVANHHKCTFIGVRCPSYSMFMTGQCGCHNDNDGYSGSRQSSLCAVMGIDADRMVGTGAAASDVKHRSAGKWFIKTSDFIKETGSHCLFQYQIVIQLSVQLFPIINGTVVLTIHGEDSGDISEELIHTEDFRLYPGLRFGKLAVRMRQIGHIKHLSISWSPMLMMTTTMLMTDRQPLSLPSPAPLSSSWISLEFVKVSPIVMTPEPITRLFCCPSQMIIKPSQTITLIDC